MNPLSTYKYIKSNFAKNLPILISIIVGVLLIYLFSLITKSTSEMMDIIANNFNTKYTTIYSNDEDPITENIFDNINKDTNVSYLLPFQHVSGHLQYKSVFGQSTIEGYNIQTQDIPKFLNDLEIKVIKGVLPTENKQEIIIHKRFALENKLKVGDYVGSEVSADYSLKGKYKISGIIDGPVMLSIINENKQNVSRDKLIKQAILIKIKDINDKSLINYLTKNAPKNIVITDYYNTYEQMTYLLSTLNTLALSLTVCIIIVLCISLGNLNYISFLNRKYEFGVLSAIGYKKSSLYFKLWKENSFVCLIGFVAGVIVTTIIAFILNVTVLEPNGKLIPLWNASGALSAFCIPLFVSFLSLIAPIKELRRTDPMGVIGGGI